MFLCSLAEIIRVSIYLLQNPWHQIRLSAKALFVYALSGLSWRCYNVLSLIWANTHPADRPQRLGIYLTCQGGKVTVSHWLWQDDHTGLYVLYWKMSWISYLYRCIWKFNNILYRKHHAYNTHLYKHYHYMLYQQHNNWDKLYLKKSFTYQYFDISIYVIMPIQWSALKW